MIPSSLRPVSFVIFCLVVSSAAAAKPKAKLVLSDFEKRVFQVTNEVRSNPRSLVPHLQKLVKKFDAKFLYLSPTVRIATQEGVAPVTEAIRALNATKPVSRLQLSEALTRAARDHRASQGESGEIGHYGPNGKSPVDRLAKYGTPVGKSGENITYGSYGGFDARDILIATVVDDGVPDRGHRHSLFDPKYKVVGIACGKHKTYDSMCVFDFATAVR